MNEVFEKIIEQLKQESIIVDDDAGHRAVEIIEQAAAEYSNGWIPCSEQTKPCDVCTEKKQNVLIVGKTGYSQKWRED